MLNIVFSLNGGDWANVVFIKGVLQKAVIEIGQYKSITINEFQSDRFGIGACSPNYRLETEVKEYPADEYLKLHIECGGSTSITICVPGLDPETANGGVTTILSYNRSSATAGREVLIPG